jgi:thiamine-monophosphate kinase
MASGEFSLIETFFNRPTGRSDIILGIGDDCALLAPPALQNLALSIDTLVAGVHFFADTNPRGLGHKALAVNLSDLAASGAKPAWCSLALTLPQIDEAWLGEFSAGFFALAAQHDIALIGGDTTQGPLAITVQVIGTIPEGEALLRSGAKPNDLIYVSGPIGNAGLGLLGRQGSLFIEDPALYAALETPNPRVALGQALLGMANACIDISDGLAADLCHILERSQVGADIEWDRLPLSKPVRKFIDCSGDLGFPLRAGDDYELCFTVSPKHQEDVERIFRQLNLDGACIGRIESKPGLRIRTGSGLIDLVKSGYEHFKPS